MNNEQGMMNFERTQTPRGIRRLQRSMFLVLCLIFGGVLTASAADVQMSIQPQLVSLLDRAVLKIEFIDTKGDAVDIPEVEGLRIQYQGQSSETRIVNMKRTSKVIHNYIVTPTRTGDFTIGPPYYKTEVGEHENSGGPYGTFDQSGNVFEWNETIIGSDRGIRGGSYSFYDTELPASYRAHSTDPTYEIYDVGFRVSEVPEPATLTVVMLGGIGLLRRRRR